MPSAPVTRVLIISKTHLDVGFTDLAHLVRERYLHDFFPRAMRVAAELRARGGSERLRWTTGSWILREALDEDARRGRRDVERAVEAGDLCWHALPFTTHTEYCERTLFEHGLTLSAELDERFGRRTHAAKMTDVPGHTRGVVSVLSEAGVDFLHIGVNPASASPQVPSLFRWRGPAAAGGAHLQRDEAGERPELVVMYQPGGYGDVQVVPGTTTAVAVELTGDNLGPRDASDVVERWAALARRFPDAELHAATFDDAAEVVAHVRAQLPVVDAEIGDSWIHGVGSDPCTTAEFRELCRTRRGWVAQGRVAASDPVFRSASTRLLLVAEHTWGLDQKTHWPEEGHWSAQDLQRVRGDAGTVRFESSWAEQRGYLDEFVMALADGGREDLAAEARLARASCAPSEPDVSDLVPCDGTEIEVAGFGFVVGDDGSILRLHGPGGELLATPTAAAGVLWLQTFDAADLERRFASYNGRTAPEDQWWARWDNTKPGLERSGAVSAKWPAMLRRLWSGARDGAAVVVMELAFEVDSMLDPVAAPARAVVTVRASQDRAGVTTVEFDLAMFDTPAARWPSATWWSFAPPVVDPTAWQMEKLGELVSPLEVVAGGGRFLHCADRVSHPDGTTLRFVDTSLVAPGAPRLMDWDDSQPAMSGGWHLCLHDNLWGTNFPMWHEGDARARVVLSTS